MKKNYILLIIRALFVYSFLYLIPLAFGINESSYSLTDNSKVPLDQKLVDLFKHQNGFFIEVGANDGIEQSNTKRLEEFHGWSGILIEPGRSTFKKLCKNRPNSKCFQCALGSFRQNNTYVYGDFDGHPMSSVNGERLNRSPKQKVLMRSLQSILDELCIRHVDFLSLDVEGYELNVLLGIDFNRTTFNYLLVEIYFSMYNEIVLLLARNGYELIENFSNYNSKDNIQWDGKHNDYLFKRKTITTQYE